MRYQNKAKNLIPLPDCFFHSTKMQDLSSFFWHLMHNIMTMREEEVATTIEFRLMYLAIQEKQLLGIHISQLAKDPEQVVEIRYMRPLDDIEYHGDYIVADNIDHFLVGLRDMFAMLDDDRAFYMSAVIRKMEYLADVASLEDQLKAISC